MKFEFTDYLIVKDEKDLEFLKKKTIKSYKGEFLLLDDFVKAYSKEVTNNEKSN